MSLGCLKVLRERTRLIGNIKTVLVPVSPAYPKSKREPKILMEVS